MKAVLSPSNFTDNLLKNQSVNCLDVVTIRQITDEESVCLLLDTDFQVIMGNDHAENWLVNDKFEKFTNRDVSGFLVDFSQKSTQCTLLNDLSGNGEKHLMTKVWRPSNLVPKLCLVSFYTINDFLKVMIRPIDEWDFLKENLKKLLIKEQLENKHRANYDHLTTREKEIVQLITSGYNSPQIASFLFISEHTVRQHRKNIHKKLETNSSTRVAKIGQLFCNNY